MSFDEWFFSMFVSYFIFEILGDTGKVQPCFLFFLNLVSTFYFECISTLYHIIKFDLLLLNGLKAVMQRNASVAQAAEDKNKNKNKSFRKSSWLLHDC